MALSSSKSPVGDPLQIDNLAPLSIKMLHALLSLHIFVLQSFRRLNIWLSVDHITDVLHHFCNVGVQHIIKYETSFPHHSIKYRKGLISIPSVLSVSSVDNPFSAMDSVDIHWTPLETFTVECFGSRPRRKVIFILNVADSRETMGKGAASCKLHLPERWLYVFPHEIITLSILNNFPSIIFCCNPRLVNPVRLVLKYFKKIKLKCSIYDVSPGTMDITQDMAASWFSAMQALPLASATAALRSSCSKHSDVQNFCILQGMQRGRGHDLNVTHLYETTIFFSTFNDDMILVMTAESHLNNPFAPPSSLNSFLSSTTIFWAGLTTCTAAWTARRSMTEAKLSFVHMLLNLKLENAGTCISSAITVLQQLVSVLHILSFDVMEKQLHWKKKNEIYFSQAGNKA